MRYTCVMYIAMREYKAISNVHCSYIVVFIGDFFRLTWYNMKYECNDPLRVKSVLFLMIFLNPSLYTSMIIDILYTYKKKQIQMTVTIKIISLTSGESY